MSFKNQVASFKDIAKDKVLETKRAVAAELFGSIIRDTPVDEGLLRANWQPTIGAPADGTTEAKDKQGGATISAAQSTALQVGLGQTVYLTNNLPYAHRVEFEGWSHTKAPRGMVRINIQRVAKNIKKLIKR